MAHSDEVAEKTEKSEEDQILLSHFSNYYREYTSFYERLQKNITREKIIENFEEITHELSFLENRALQELEEDYVKVLAIHDARKRWVSNLSFKLKADALSYLEDYLNENLDTLDKKENQMEYDLLTSTMTLIYKDLLEIEDRLVCYPTSEKKQGFSKDTYWYRESIIHENERIR
jgi:hypothetical protein